MATVAFCICDRRISAMHNGEFYYLAGQRVWCFTHDEPRSMTPKARWLGGERGVENHEGEPITYECCVWCGGDLPGVATYYTNPLQQADGEGEG